MNRRALARAWPYAAAAAAAALVFVRGPLSGHPFYFRDLSLYFLPLRRFVLDGLRHGTLRFWNPYVHEGEPLALLPVSYPFDLLQLLRPDEVGISFVLALHVPLAAVWMMALCRKGLGLPSTAAAGAAIVYSLGGFALSTINLYVYAQALAWAPAAILGLLLAARGDARKVALGALAVGVLVSTTAAEMVAQAIVIGVLLALPCPRAGLLRMAAALGLGAALAAPPAFVLAGIAADSARASGFAPEVVLSHSIHPLTLAQVAIAGFYGDTARLTDRWWGGNFFPRGFPYFLSLYLGLATLATAAVGALQDRGPRRRLAAIAAVALLLALGPWGLGGAFVEAFDMARRFRYPSKLFFAVHLAAALLVGLGIDALAARAAGAWRRLAAIALAAGALLATAPLWPRAFPSRAQWFASGFFPAEFPWPERMALLDWMLRDAATGAAVALALGALAVLATRGRLTPRAASVGLVALLAADLLRAGSGLNPSTSAAFFIPSPEVARHHAAWRAAGRVFTCDPASSEAYARGRSVRRDHERWTFAVLRDTLAPAFNVSAGVASALSPDLTMLVPPERLIDSADAGCPSIERLLAPLRAAGVAHVISLDPLSHPDLVPQSEERPPTLAPVAVRAYRLRDPLSMTAFVGADADVVARIHDPGHIELAVTTPARGSLIVREAYAAGWKAAIDGRAAEVGRADGRHIAVAVPAGTHAVVLDYGPPGLRLGVLVGALAALVTIGLLAAPRRRGEANEIRTPGPEASP